MIYQAGTGIYGALVAAGVNGGSAIYVLQAPTGATYPYIVISPITSLEDDSDSVDLRREIWQVKVIATSPSAADTIERAIRDVLHYGTFSAGTAWNLVWCHAENAFMYPEMVNDKLVIHAGSSYRVLLNAKSSHSS